MSITFEYSFNCDLGVEELAGAINRVVGTSLVASDGPVYSCRFLGIPLALALNEAEDDLGIDFSSYRYQLWNKTWDGDSLRVIQLEALALVAYVLRDTLGIDDGLLSYEMQRVLARYATADGVWCDTTAGPVAVDPLPHMVTLQSRLNSFFP